MKKKTTPQPSPDEKPGDLVTITVAVTRHQKKELGRDRSHKTRQALVLAGYSELPITPQP